MTNLNTEDFKEWAFNPVTNYFINDLISKRTEYLEKLGTNFYKDKIDSIQQTIGICLALQATINAIESYKEVKDDK